MSDDRNVYTADDEPLTRRVTRALKGAIGFGGKDINLPDEQEDTPQRRAEYAREKAGDNLRRSDATIKKLQGFGDTIRQQMLADQLRKKK